MLTTWHNNENNRVWLACLSMKFRRSCFIPGKIEIVLKPQGFLVERIIVSHLVGICNVHLGGVFADYYEDDCVCMHLEQPKYLSVSFSLLI